MSNLAGLYGAKEGRLLIECRCRLTPQTASPLVPPLSQASPDALTNYLTI